MYVRKYRIKPPSPANRFSLRVLLAAVTWIAIVCGLTRWLGEVGFVGWINATFFVVVVMRVLHIPKPLPDSIARLTAVEVLVIVIIILFLFALILPAG